LLVCATVLFASALAARSWAGTPLDGGLDGASDDGTAGDGSLAGDGAADGDATADGQVGTDAPAADGTNQSTNPPEDEGCQCRAASTPGSAPWLTGLLLALPAVLRRRRS
jgi:MYXO-CTERM domain-containing protein